MKSMVTAIFVCEDADEKKVIESLEQWYCDTKVRMDHCSIWGNTLHHTTEDKEDANHNKAG